MELDFRSAQPSKLISVTASGNSHLIRAHFYDSPVANEKDSRHEWHELFRKTDQFELTLGGSTNDKGQKHQKGVDVKLAVDMVRFAAANIYDRAILIAGDADFIPAVEAVKEFGKQVRLFGIEGRTNARLLEKADFRTNMGRDRWKNILGI